MDGGEVLGWRSSCTLYPFSMESGPQDLFPLMLTGYSSAPLFWAHRHSCRYCGLGVAVAEDGLPRSYAWPAASPVAQIHWAAQSLPYPWRRCIY